MVKYLHVTHGAGGDIDLSQYDAVLLSYCARLCFDGYVTSEFLRKLAAFSGITAIAIQDEYDFVETERTALAQIKPDVVFTCIPAGQRELVYPRANPSATGTIRFAGVSAD